MLLGPGVFYSLSMFSFFAKHLIHNVLFFVVIVHHNDCVMPVVIVTTV